MSRNILMWDINLGYHLKRQKYIHFLRAGHRNVARENIFRDFGDIRNLFNPSRVINRTIGNRSWDDLYTYRQKH
eukprot:UN15469